MAVEISSSDVAPKGGIKYGFQIDSAGDVKDLPPPGGSGLYPNAALCSTALDLETYDVYYLRKTGWIKGGGS